MNNLISIRQAEQQDLNFILALYQSSGLVSAENLSIEKALKLFNKLKTYPNYKIYVAEINKEIVGVFSLLIMDKLAHAGKPEGIVEDVAVAPAHQNKGIGKLMMGYAQKLCVEAGCYKLVLSSNKIRVDAHAFYQHLGFEHHGYSFVIKPNQS